MEIISENYCFGGIQGVYRHASKLTHCDMTFGLFLPGEAKAHPVPLLWYLSGLTCTHENAMFKAGAQAWAAEAGIAIIFPDTSPRGEDIPDDAAYDLGQSAGFYLDAIQAPWVRHYRMWSYISQELPELVSQNFSIDAERESIMGHSMGGHGALTLGLTLGNKRFASLSAFAPICNPSSSDWGKKQFKAYIGEQDAEAWRAHDSSILMQEKGFEGPILIDQGVEDEFLDLLNPETLASAMAERRQEGTFRMQKGYDHSYYFIASFMEEHIRFHAEALYNR